MIQKHITLRAYCGSCLNLVFKQVYLLRVKKVEHIPKANNLIEGLFPAGLKCKDCDTCKIDLSYSYYHDHKFTAPAETKAQIERCKAQIAATYDTNSDIPHTERVILRESFQKHYQALLDANNISTL